MAKAKKYREVSIALEGAGPIAWTRMTDPCPPASSHKEHEEDVFLDKVHQVNGNFGIPTIAVKRAIEEAARYDGRRIPGEGKKTYTKIFERSLICKSATVDTGVALEDIKGEWMALPSDGKKGGSRRVLKKIPVIQDWRATFEFIVIDKRISKEVLADFARDSGMVIGIGFWRSERGGSKGRYLVDKIEWK